MIIFIYYLDSIYFVLDTFLNILQDYVVLTSQKHCNTNTKRRHELERRDKSWPQRKVSLLKKDDQKFVIGYIRQNQEWEGDRNQVCLNSHLQE